MAAGIGGVQPIPDATSGGSRSWNSSSATPIAVRPSAAATCSINVGQSCGEVARKIHKPLGAADRGYTGDNLSDCGVADRRDLII